MLTLALTTIQAIVGAVINRFRGGGVVALPGETSVPDHKRTQVRRITYALTGAAFVFLHTYNPWQAAAAAVVLFVTLLTGWGVPIGACGGWETQPLKEFGPLDWIADGITMCLAGPPEQNKRLWGTVWLSCWGLITGFLLYLTGASPFVMLAFGLIGITYWSVFTIYLMRGRAAYEGWETAEIVVGFISFSGL